MQNKTKAFFAAVVKRSVSSAIDACYEVGCVPYITVVLNHPEVSFIPFPNGLKPTPAVLPIKDEMVELKTLTLSLDMESIRDYTTSETGISFKCRFSGNITDVFVPYQAVAALGSPDFDVSYPFPIDYEAFASTAERATMISGVEPPSEPEVQVAPQPTTKPVPHLRVVK